MKKVITVAAIMFMFAGVAWGQASGDYRMGYRAGQAAQGKAVNRGLAPAPQQAVVKSRTEGRHPGAYNNRRVPSKHPGSIKMFYR